LGCAGGFVAEPSAGNRCRIDRLKQHPPDESNQDEARAVASEFGQRRTLPLLALILAAPALAMSPGSR